MHAQARISGLDQLAGGLDGDDRLRPGPFCRVRLAQREPEQRGRVWGGLDRVDQGVDGGVGCVELDECPSTVIGAHRVFGVCVSVLVAKGQQSPAVVGRAGGQPAGAEGILLQRWVEGQSLPECLGRRASAAQQAQRLAAQRVGGGAGGIGLQRRVGLGQRAAEFSLRQVDGAASDVGRREVGRDLDRPGQGLQRPFDVPGIPQGQPVLVVGPRGDGEGRGGGRGGGSAGGEPLRRGRGRRGGARAAHQQQAQHSEAR